MDQTDQTKENEELENIYKKIFYEVETVPKPFQSRLNKLNNPMRNRLLRPQRAGVICDPEKFMSYFIDSCIC